MAESKKLWYVLRAISGKEKVVKEMIEAACKNNPNTLGAKISQILVPTEIVYVTRGGKKVEKEKILFSGYIFVEACLDSEIESFLQNTSNVIDFVRSRSTVDRRPDPIPEAQINSMLRAAEKQIRTDKDNDFVVGENVKVNDGPFSGFDGVITEVNAEKQELTVEVRVFGRETPLKLLNSQVVRE